LHFSINSEPFYLRFARPIDLQWLMPVFWIGFNIEIPGSSQPRRPGMTVLVKASPGE